MCRPASEVQKNYGCNVGFQRNVLFMFHAQSFARERARRTSMTVSTFIQPDPSTQVVDQYLAVMDGDVSVMSRVAAAFAPHQSAPAAMTVTVDAGPIFSGTTLTEVAAQTTATIVAPVTNPRIDRVVIDRVTGAVSVVTGVESATPTPPAIPADAVPIARLDLTPATTAITNALITDERGFVPVGMTTGGALLNVQVFRGNGTYNPTPGTTSVIVEIIGAGGSGGGSASPASGQGAAASGGGAGSFGRARFTSGFAGVEVTVGSGGASTSAGAVSGNAGGASSFGALLSAPGGAPGFAGTSVAGPRITQNSGGVAFPTGANLLAGYGVSGGVGLVMSSSSVAGGTGGIPVYGGGSQGSFNGNGGTVLNPGGGGGGGSSIAGNPAHSGGGGGDGLVTIYEYA
jgi:hypothetical protein